MPEAKFQTIFNKWARNVSDETFAAELKIARGPTLYWSQVQEHQETALWVAKHKRLSYKIADVGLAKKPFDSFVLVSVPAYIVVHFPERGNREFFMIDIDVWLALRNGPFKQKYPGLTRDMCRNLGLTRRFGADYIAHPLYEAEMNRLAARYK